MMIRTAILLIAALPPAALAADSAPYHDPGMQKIAQVAIVCKNVEACSQRWANVLGMPVATAKITRPGREVAAVYRGKPTNGQAKLAFYSAGQTQIELIEPVGGDTAWKQGLDENGESVHHLGFQVKDLDKTIAEFESQGMPVLHRGRYDSNDGSYVYMDSKDKLGVIIELLHSDAK